MKTINSITLFDIIYAVSNDGYLVKMSILSILENLDNKNHFKIIMENIKTKTKYTFQCYGDAKYFERLIEGINHTFFLNKKEAVEYIHEILNTCHDSLIELGEK